MFKAPKFLGINPAKFIWFWLIRLIQTKVEHRLVTNDELAAFVRGDIVVSNGPGTVELATAATGWIGVCSQPFPVGATRVARNNGYALVHMIDNIVAGDLVEGQPVSLSMTPGAATMVPGIRIGILANASGYNGDSTSDDYNPFAYVCLGYECSPVESSPL